MRRGGARAPACLRGGRGRRRGRAREEARGAPPRGGDQVSRGVLSCAMHLGAIGSAPRQHPLEPFPARKAGPDLQEELPLRGRPPDPAEQPPAGARRLMVKQHCILMVKGRCGCFHRPQ